MPQKPLTACVDDDESVREALEGFLKASGFNSGVFSSADEFLQSAWLDETACLITDIHLGGMSGLQPSGCIGLRDSHHCHHGISQRAGS